MALKAWMKKNGCFDMDVCRKLETQFGVKDPEHDFSCISKSHCCRLL